MTAKIYYERLFIISSIFLKSLEWKLCISVLGSVPPCPLNLNERLKYNHLISSVSFFPDIFIGEWKMIRADTRIYSNIMNTHIARSSRICARNCLVVQRCAAFMYHKASLTCGLSDGVRMPQASWVLALGIRNYERRLS